MWSKIKFNNILYINYVDIFLFIIIILCVFIIINLYFTNYYKNYSFNFNNYIIIYIYTFMLTFYCFKFYIINYKINYLTIHIYNELILLNKNNILDFFFYNNNNFGIIISILSLIIGLICLLLLGNKNLLKNISNIYIYLLFHISVIFMTQTSNLFIMFISFELIFIPTIYIIYKIGYSKKIDKNCKYLIIWTLFGAFLVLCSLSCIYNIYGTINFNILKYCYFTQKQLITMYFIILFGFSIKIPLVPFQHWLLKVHVEAPAAFSIFLSGFLVKSAIYCVYSFNLILQSPKYNIVFIIWVLLSLIVATFSLFFQNDFKKLVAWATVQEMTFILLILIIKNNINSSSLYIFILLHGIISSYMFFLVDIFQKKFNTRDLNSLQGLNILIPKSSKYIWILILFFNGFPLTAKFFIEWDFITILLYTNNFYILFIIFIVNFFGTISFSKFLFSMLYGIPEKNFEKIEFQKNEIYILNFLIIIMLFLSFILFIYAKIIFFY